MSRAGVLNANRNVGWDLTMIWYVTSFIGEGWTICVTDWIYVKTQLIGNILIKVIVFCHASTYCSTLTCFLATYFCKVFLMNSIKSEGTNNKIFGPL